MNQKFRVENPRNAFSISGMWVCIGLCVWTLSASAQTVQQASTEIGLKFAQLTRMWDGMGTPGMRADLRELSRITEEKAVRVSYEIETYGVPQNQEYSLFFWPITGGDADLWMSGLKINSDNRLVCGEESSAGCANSELGDPVTFVFSGARGEPCRLILVSKDERTKVFFSDVPDPITSVEGNCSIEAFRLLPGFRLALVIGRGFQPNEELDFMQSTIAGVNSKTVNADSNGEYADALVFTPSGKESRSAFVRMKASTCAPAVAFVWEAAD